MGGCWDQIGRDHGDSPGNDPGRKEGQTRLGLDVTVGLWNVMHRAGLISGPQKLIYWKMKINSNLCIRNFYPSSRRT